MHDFEVPAQTMRLRLSKEPDYGRQSGSRVKGQVGTGETEPATRPTFSEKQPSHEFPDREPTEEVGHFVRGAIIASVFGILVYAAIAWLIFR